MHNGQAIVVIPVYKSQLDIYEQVSYQQCIKVLIRYPIVLVAPTGLDLTYYTQLHPEVCIERFSPSYFANIDGYNRLLLSKEFYLRFRVYEYILIYQLDSFVFRDELQYWCEQGYDYIGAPWFEKYELANAASPLIGVGNGGFSLRDPKAFLRALHNFSWLERPAELWDNYRSLKFASKVRNLPHLIRKLTISNNSFHLFSDFRENEDIFWGKYINRNFCWFKVPDCEVALAFSFEVNPEQLFKMNNCTLPFGCHGWRKYNYNFWKSFIQEHGYALSNPD